LLERDGENKKSVEYLRLKTRYLKEKLQLYISKCHTNETKLMEENKQLSKNYLKNGNELQNLQKKLIHFITYETMKYNNMSTMNMKICLTQLKKLFYAEKIIIERILGWKWQNPYQNRILQRSRGEIIKPNVSNVQVWMPPNNTEDLIFELTCADLKDHIIETRKNIHFTKSSNFIEEEKSESEFSETESFNTKINEFEESREVDKELWHLLGHPVNEKMSYIWNQLEVELQAYYDVLHKRQADVDEVFELSEQNSKLRSCLVNYGVILAE
jgi:hypothetical protein